MNRKHNRTILWKICSGVTLVILCAILWGCQEKAEKSGEKVANRSIDSVKEAHVNELMALSGVVGVYVGQLPEGTPCIGVMVVKKTAALKKNIPSTLEGYPVTIEETGEIRPMDLQIQK